MINSACLRKRPAAARPLVDSESEISSLFGSPHKLRRTGS